MTPASPLTIEKLEEQVRRLEDQVREMHERESMRPGAMLMKMLPPEVRQHLRAARRERLLALRSMLDAAIAQAQEEPRSPRRSESVHID